MPLSKPVKKQQLLLPSPKDFHLLDKEKKEHILKRLSTDNLIIYLEYIVASYHTPTKSDYFTLEQIVEDSPSMVAKSNNGFNKLSLENAMKMDSLVSRKLFAGDNNDYNSSSSSSSLGLKAPELSSIFNLPEPSDSKVLSTDNRTKILNSLPNAKNKYEYFGWPDCFKPDQNVDEPPSMMGKSANGFNKLSGDSPMKVVGPKLLVGGGGNNNSHSCSSTSSTSSPSLELKAPELFSIFNLPEPSEFNELPAENRTKILNSLPNNVKNKYEYFCWSYKLNQLFNERPNVGDDLMFNWNSGSPHNY